MALGVWLLVKASCDPFWYSVGRGRLDRKSIVRKGVYWKRWRVGDSPMMSLQAV